MDIVNFWAPLYKKYPKAGKHFKNWLRAYEKENLPDKNIEDFPPEIQLGIFIKYTYEFDSSARYWVLNQWLGNDLHIDIKRVITDGFKYFKRELK